MATTAPADGLLEAPTEGWRHRYTRHPVAAFLVRRVAAGVLTLIVVSMVIFAVLQIIPGDVTEIILGRNATPDRIAAVHASLHLDESVPSRYLTFIWGFVTGNFGDSSAALAQGQTLSVWDAIRTPLGNSLVLAGITTILFIPLSLFFGVVAALRAGRPTDSVLSLTALTLGAMPEFLIGTLLIVIFFTQLDLLPPVSLIPPGQTPLSNPKELVLPVLTLLGVSTAFGSRLLRASMIEVLGEDFVAMARLNGYRERRVVFRYALRNALAPSAQILAQQVQYLIGGIIIVESVFNYPGIGSKLVQAIQVRDTQVVTIIATIIAGIYILINILADLAVVLLVPKLRTRA
jgi:peptide/nickel transport system permease protein